MFAVILRLWLAVGNSHCAVCILQNTMFPNGVCLKLANKMAEMAKSHIITPEPIEFIDKGELIRQHLGNISDSSVTW